MSAEEVVKPRSLVDRLLPGDRPLFSWATEALAVLGIFGFILAIGVNSLVFGFWGVDFLQLASPSDVIMSGIAATASLMVLMGAGLATYLLTQRLPSQVIIVMCFGSLGLASAMDLGFSYWEIVPWVGIYIGRVFIGISLGALATRSKHPIVVICLILLTCLEFALDVVNTTKYGYLDGRSWIVGAEKGCDGDSTTLWIGERAVVYVCEDHRVHIMIQPQAATIIADPRYTIFAPHSIDAGGGAGSVDTGGGAESPSGPGHASNQRVVSNPKGAARQSAGSVQPPSAAH